MYDVTIWLTNNCNTHHGLLKHILTKFSRKKGNQAITFSQLKVYNMRNIFLEKSYTKCDGEAIPRPFLKNQN